MTWVKLDDGFFDHPKAITVGPYGVALFLASCCWSASNLTDGKIPKNVVNLLVSKANVTKTTYAKLVEVGLWHDMGTHYEIHDYLHHNPSRSQVEKERARWRGYKRGSTAESNGDSAVESIVESNADSAPSRPVPSPLGIGTPPTVGRCALTGRAGEVLTALLTAERSKAGRIQNRAAWERTVTARLTTEHGDRINRLVEDYPEAPPEVIAGQVAGESSNLRYFTRKDSAS